MSTPLVTAAQLTAFFPARSAVAIADYVPALDSALREFGITTPFRIAAFVAQVGHESLGLKFWKELWGPTPQQLKYEPPSDVAKDLGNTLAGDGYRFRGRGPIQITGRANYLRCGAALGVDLIADPGQLEHSAYGFRSSGWFWSTRGLNDFADRDTSESFRFITRRVNGAATMGAPSHHGMRVQRWLAARAVLGLQPPLEAPKAA
jgi:putative chitinase